MGSCEHEVLRNELVALKGLAAHTYELGPFDYFAHMDGSYISWPVFLDYELDADRLIEAFKALSLKYPVLGGRLKPDPQKLYVLEVATDGSQGDEKCSEQVHPEKAKIPFSEVKSGITMAAAILDHSQLGADNAVYPFCPELPFYTEKLNPEALIKGEAPMAKMRLTHLKDGCVLNITVAHALCDADRFIDLYRDLGRAYLGKEIPERSFDRSWLWPDQLAKHYPFLGEDIAKLPRTALPHKHTLVVPSFPEETSKVELVYFPKETITAMKSSVTPFLSEGEFVSSNDVLVGILWMLRCEMEAAEDMDPESTGMKISNTLGYYALDLIKNGIDYIPSNTFANAVILLAVTSAGMELDELPRQQIFATLATLQHNSVKMFREQPAVAAQAMLVFYNIVHTGEIPDAGPVTFLTSNYTKTAVDSVDFGKGPPRMIYFIPPAPYFGNHALLAPAPGGDGVILHLGLFGSRCERLKNSQILKELAPGAKLLYSDFTHDQFNAMLQS